MYYVGPERFEPTQRDAQWRNRCSAEVQSYSNYRTGTGKQPTRGRNPILNEDPIKQSSKLWDVEPNPCKIGAPNAVIPQDWSPVRIYARPRANDAVMVARGMEKPKRPPVPTMDVELEEARAAIAKGGNAAEPNSQQSQQQQHNHVVRFSPAGSSIGSARGKRPGTGGSSRSTLSGGGSSIVSSSTATSGGGGFTKQELASHEGGYAPGTFAGEDPERRTATGGSRSSASSRTGTGSTKSSVLYEALGEEMKKRVIAEREVLRLAKLLEDRPC